MGYNSVVMILNDHLGEIEKDSSFGKKVGDGISRCNCYNEQVDLSTGCGTGAMVIGCQHADITQIIAVGGNCATVLANLWGSHHTEESQIRLLKAWADNLGYNISKKPKRK